MLNYLNNRGKIVIPNEEHLLPEDYGPGYRDNGAGFMGVSIGRFNKWVHEF